MNGFVLVTPHVSDDDDSSYYGRAHRARMRMPLGPMKDVRPSGGKVRVGYVDVLGGPVRFRSVSIAPVFDPLADSMGPWARDLAVAA